jgi:hypothetical protein
MNKEQQRIAIAEACGYEFKTHEGKSYCFFKELDGWFYWENIIPHYLNDLNAMHEAEKSLNTKELWESYKNYMLIFMTEPVCATAAQRAEAFLKTIDKWTTNQPTEP